MFHHVARARPGHLLFTDATEARALWVRVVGRTTGLTALCLMPNHLHLLHQRDVLTDLRQALSAFARWSNARTGRRGPLFERIPSPDEVAGVTKIRRQVRYIHLNPCRARLVADPISWPFSTHLDALGLVVDPVRGRVPDTHSFHRYVSSDPTVHPAGTDLPVVPGGLLTLEQVLAGVSFATRTPADELVRRRGPARRLLVASSRGLTDASAAHIADHCGVTRSAVHRTAPVANPVVAALAADARSWRWEARVAAHHRGFAVDR